MRTVHTMSIRWFVFVPLAILLSSGGTFLFADEQPLAGVELSVAELLDKPVIGRDSPGAEGIKYGFEGGRAVKVGDVYHLFTSEMIGDPPGVKMKLAHWSSGDRRAWKRVSTLSESSAKFDGGDPRAALWSPMPIWNEQEGRWNLFYVAYRAAPNTTDKWLLNYEGRICRAVSQTSGREGIGGPYKDEAVILQPDKDSQPWEGLQGVDSFFPYQVGRRWYGFYGSANTEVVPCRVWRAGLAAADSLAGPWRRLPQGNPVPLEKTWGVENPVVTRLAGGWYVAVYDLLGPVDQLAYTSSPDGVQWTAGCHLTLPNAGKWLLESHTPLGLIEEPDGTCTLLFTASCPVPDGGRYKSVCLLTVRAKSPPLPK